MRRLFTNGRLIGPVLGAMLIATQTALGAAYPPEASLDEVRARIREASPEHPRLLATAAELAAIREALGEQSQKGDLARAVVAQAEAYADAPPVTRTLEGRRLLGVSRQCLKRVLCLTMAHRLTGEEHFAARAEQEMLAAARFENWNPSHFLDVAEMAFALAVGYDWLYEVLSPASRAEIRTALIDKAVSLPFATNHRGWVNAENNWGQVCHGGLTAAALAVMEDEPDLAARTIHQAAHHVTRSMAAFAPHGSYPEGPGYWSYGTTYNVLLIALLESALDTDFGLSLAPGFAETGEYINLVAGPSGRYFNYADGGDGRAAEPALHWLAKRYQRPDWTLNEPGLLRSDIRRLLRADPRGSHGRFLPLTLLWMAEPDPATVNRMPLHWSGGGSVPITLHRSAWADPRATFVGLKAGSPSANHGHMDTGSFVLDALGVRWAVDLGAEGYHGIESRGMNLWDRRQDSDRWKIFRLNSLSHNTLVIDGALQRVGGHGQVVRFSGDPDRPFSVIELSEVYAGQASSVQRGVALLPSGEVLIQDELRGLRPGSRVRWGMLTPARPVEPGTATLTLHQGDAALTLSLLAPAKMAWQLVDTAAPRNEWDSPNPNTRMAAFEATAPDSGELTLAVLATPGPGQPSIGASPSLPPLADWASQSSSRSSLR